MYYGNEYRIELPSSFELQSASAAEINQLFEHAHCVSHFSESPDGEFCHASGSKAVRGGLVFRINKDRLIEINDTIDRNPPAIRNTVGDIVSFQFVSRAKRTEFIGRRINIHDLGPAIIVTIIPKVEETIRLAKPNEQIKHVMLHTTLSGLMERTGETLSEYPDWFRESVQGENEKPRQRVLFLSDDFRDIIWNCFNLPFSGKLLQRWLTFKFEELLCVGLQVIKQNQFSDASKPEHYSHKSSNKIVRARNILDKEYARPPRVPELARKLGVSETQLRIGFKSVNGVSIRQYCTERRIEAAKYLLKEDRQSISEIADIVGFQDQSAFSRAFRRLCGTSPLKWKRSHG